MYEYSNLATYIATDRYSHFSTHYADTLRYTCLPCKRPTPQCLRKALPRLMKALKWPCPYAGCLTCSKALQRAINPPAVWPPCRPLGETGLVRVGGTPSQIPNKIRNCAEALR